MKALIPNTFRENANMAPERINENHRRLIADYRYEKDQRWFYVPLHLPFRDLTNADSTIKRTLEVYGLASPTARIVGRELYIYGTADKTFTITSSLTDWDDMSVVGKGTAVKAKLIDQKSFPLSGYETFRIDAGSTWTVVDGVLVLWLAVDRFSGVPATAPSNYLISDDDTLAEAKAKLNNFETAFQSICTEAENARLAGGITICQFPVLGHTGAIATYQRDVPVPKRGRTCTRAELHVAADVGVGIVAASVIDDNGGGSTLYSLNITSSGSTTAFEKSSSDTNQAQANSDSDDVNEDWVVRFTRENTSGTIHRAYVVLYWE